MALRKDGSLGMASRLLSPKRDATVPRTRRGGRSGGAVRDGERPWGASGDARAVTVSGTRQRQCGDARAVVRAGFAQLRAALPEEHGVAEVHARSTGRGRRDPPGRTIVRAVGGGVGLTRRRATFPPQRVWRTALSWLRMKRPPRDGRATPRYDGEGALDAGARCRVRSTRGRPSGAMGARDRASALWPTPTAKPRDHLAAT